MNTTDEIKIGDKVETCVFSGSERISMFMGIVISIKDQIAEVDIMSLHGGAPWIVYEVLYHLRKCS